MRYMRRLAAALTRAKRRKILRRMAREGQAAGLYEGITVEREQCEPHGTWEPCRKCIRDRSNPDGVSS